MLGWLAENSWAIWLIAAGALAVTEMATLDFTLAMLAVGALAGAVAAFFLPGLWLVHVVVALGVAAALLMLLRPTLLARVRSAPGYRSSVEQLAGSEGRALAAITADSGEIKVAGEVWTARSNDGIPIPEGAAVVVVRIDGTTAYVYQTPGQILR